MKRREVGVRRGEAKYTFSVGPLVESLQGAGVPTSEAIRIARSAEKHYQGSSGKDISLERLVARVAKELEDELGAAVAERFRVQTPPFVPLTVHKGDEQTPFSRRVLAKSLERFGLRFKEAYAVASQVEQSLRSQGYEDVHERELAHLTALALEARSGRDARMRFEAELGTPISLQVLEPSGARFPFSRGILAQSLMAVGLGPDLAYSFAKQVETNLLHHNAALIRRDDLHREVRGFLHEEAGEDFARRYDLLRSVRRPEQPIIVLLGGAPGVGKSSLAAELAYRLGIRRVVSSDAVREALRSLIGPELSPGLHRSSFAVWRSDLLPEEQQSAKPKRKRVVRGFQAQAQQLATALRAIVARGVMEGTSLVLEGIHLVPGLLNVPDGATIVELVLTVEDAERHRSRFAAREGETRARRSSQGYLEHFSEIRMIHDFVARRAKQEGVGVIEASNFEEAVDRAIERILDATLTEHPTPAEVAPGGAGRS